MRQGIVAIAALRVRLMKASAATRWAVNPSQKAAPKISCGVRPESRLVAKNAPTMGRMVATARAVANARIIHSRWSATSPRRMWATPFPSATRKKALKKAVAAVWLAPPIGIRKPMSMAETPTKAPEATNSQPFRRCQAGAEERTLRLNWTGASTRNRSPGRMWDSVSKG